MDKGKTDATSKLQTTTVTFVQSSPQGGEPEQPLIPYGRRKHLHGDYAYCLYLHRFKNLSIAQMALGVVIVLVGLYTHFPFFSGGAFLLPGEDRLWYATWIGGINLLAGVIGRLATKFSLGHKTHIRLRRIYFLMNASFLIFINGIGIGAYSISLSHYDLVNPGPNETFTTLMAFISIVLLFTALTLALIAVMYQVFSTKQCNCRQCEPMSKRKAATKA